MKVLVTGVGGQLGFDVMNELAKRGHEGIGSDILPELTNSEMEYIQMDITDENAVNEIINKVNPDAVIHCAAWTAVDAAEDEENIDKVRAINAKGTENIAKACNKIDAKMMYISTDYVFDGTASEPYTEEIPYKPLGVYGVTKADGEKEVLSILPEDSYILRTAWLYGFYGKNFVFTMINLMNTKDKISVVSDQFGTPTNAQNLANVICTLINKSASENIPSGVYHCTDLGQTNWYEFAKEIHHFGIKYGKITGNCVVNPCTTEEYPVKAKRPAYSVLNKDKLMKNLNITLPEWKENKKLQVNIVVFSWVGFAVFRLFSLLDIV